MICVPEEALDDIKSAMVALDKRTDKKDMFGRGKIVGTLMLIKTLEEKFTVEEGLA